MSVLSQLAQTFTSVARERGKDYFRDDRVIDFKFDQRQISAKVVGSDTYEVTVRRDDGQWDYRCDCPYAQDHDDPCKHIWATLLKANQNGSLAELNNRNRISVTQRTPSGWTPARQAAQPAWMRQFSGIREIMQEQYHDDLSIIPAASATKTDEQRIAYVVDLAETIENGIIRLMVGAQVQKKGEWSRPRQLSLFTPELAQLPDPIDRQILQMLVGSRVDSYRSFDQVDEAPSHFEIYGGSFDPVLHTICQTGRCFITSLTDPRREQLHTLQWDDAAPWEFWLEVIKSAGGRQYMVDGSFRRGSERMHVNDPDVLLAPGWMIHRNAVARVQSLRGIELAVALRKNMLQAKVPLDQGPELLHLLYSLPALPRVELPEELSVNDERPAPKPRLTVTAPGRTDSDTRLKAAVSFDYGGQIVDAPNASSILFEPQTRRAVHRDLPAEAVHLATLRDQGLRTIDRDSRSRFTLRLTPSRLPRLVRDLTQAGWHVEAEGKLYRQPGEISMRVASGIDWFELSGEVTFGEMSVSLPRLLAALRKGEKSIRLDDGTFGLLPEEWLKKYGLLASVGEESEDNIRFAKRQVGVLDVLLASMPEASVDEVFERARDELMNFQGVTPADPPATFTGSLRAYQRDGLGWVQFLRRFGFGGCLADDMGLGKTVQVLALLEERRQIRAQAEVAQRAGPSLVVVPKSLVFNWKQEAGRFTPGMRVLDHTGIARHKETAEHFDHFDLVLTTYGTLRRDAELFKDINFDYVVLDEAQAIKNAQSGSAKAARLLRCDHRLALSGTPVQNHLGELWSLFEFLNPGMLGAASVFKMGTGAGTLVEPETREMLSKALRPFILRRTKQQVASDLPAKHEQTILCELEPAQREHYEELRNHYRQSLLERVTQVGMNKAKIQVLEALLRLRQAACHPGLIDKTKVDESSAKLDMLMEQLLPVLEEGHKALVFSQFTSLLAIVRRQLDAQSIPYEYLDGKTRDRQERVERFQDNPDSKLFLISLKAGGLGLNLTAAEYVFLLDPWWNPAVEAQAIDRAHRIGQSRQVFAYRLIAKDTVEEKVLALQQTKRDLADAIINADNSVIANLGREELEMLLG